MFSSYLSFILVVQMALHMVFMYMCLFMQRRHRGNISGPQIVLKADTDCVDAVGDMSVSSDVKPGDCEQLPNVDKLAHSSLVHDDHLYCKTETADELTSLSDQSAGPELTGSNVRTESTELQQSSATCVRTESEQSDELLMTDSGDHNDIHRSECSVADETCNSQSKLSHSAIDSHSSVLHCHNDSQSKLSHCHSDSQSNLLHSANDSQPNVSHCHNDSQSKLSHSANDLQSNLSHCHSDSQSNILHSASNSQSNVSQGPTESQSTMSHCHSESQSELSHCTTDSQCNQCPSAVTMQSLDVSKMSTLAGTSTSTLSELDVADTEDVSMCSSTTSDISDSGIGTASQDETSCVTDSNGKQVPDSENYATDGCEVTEVVDLTDGRSVELECQCGAQYSNPSDKLHVVECQRCHSYQHATCVKYDLTDPLRGNYLCPHCHVIEVCHFIPVCNPDALTCFFGYYRHIFTKVS